MSLIASFFLIFIALANSQRVLGEQAENHLQTCEDEALSEKEGGELWARVDGIPITRGEVDMRIQPQLQEIYKQMYNLRKQHLENLIKYKLLEREAAQRNVSLEKLVETEVKSKIKAIDENEVKNFSAAVQSRSRGVQLDEARIRKTIYAQRYYAAYSEYVEQLKQKFPVEILLEEPKPFVRQVSTKDDPRTGNEGAPVTLVEFIDFQCPGCGVLHGMLKGILKDFDGKVKLIVRDYPTKRHQFAAKAAEAAACAHEQGKFWEYSDMLYQNQNALDPDNLKLYAGSLNLDVSRFSECLESGKYRDEVEEDKKDAIRAGVVGTPTLFINDVKVFDLRPEAIKATITRELSAVQAKKPEEPPQ